MGQECCSPNAPRRTKQITDITKKTPKRPRDRRKGRHTRDSLDSRNDSDSTLKESTNNSCEEEESMGHSMTASMECTLHTKAENEKARKAFREAFEKNNDSLARHFVREYPELDLLQTKFDNGDDLLHVAVRNKSHNLILYLLENNASPNHQNRQTGDTSLHTAVRTRKVKIVALLCKYGADPNITNNEYVSPLAIASDYKDDDILELLEPDTLGLLKKITSDEAPSLRQTSSAIDGAVSDILGENTGTTPQTSSFNATNAYAITGRVSSMKLSESLSPNSTFEEKLNDSEKKRMEVIKLSRQNPFGKLKRAATRNALAEMDQITNQSFKLPTLATWLEKKQISFPYKWQKRWVIVQGTHILWSDKQRNITDAKDIKQRKRFNNSVSLLSISEIKPVTGKSQRKFTFAVGTRNKHKEYLWKCSTKKDRNFWIKGLKKHIAHTKSVLTYLGNT